MANGILNGTDLKVYDGSTLIAYATNATININHSPRSISNKESGGWEENMEGMRNWDISVDAMYAWLTATGDPIGGKTLSELFTSYIDTRAKMSVTFGVTTSGTADTKYTGDVWMTSASLTAPLEDSATYSASFQGTGQLTQTVAS